MGSLSLCEPVSRSSEILFPFGFKFVQAVLYRIVVVKDTVFVVGRQGFGSFT